MSWIPFNLRSQHCSSILNTTDPTVNIWDWRQEYYNDFYLQSNPGVATTIISPFYPPNGIGTNENLNKFYTAYATNGTIGIDFHPEDGWELLYKDFGSNLSPVTNPTFGLYNKYLGIVRVFFLITDFPGNPQNGAMISMKFNSSRESALFSYAEPILSPVKSFIEDQVMKVPNKYINESQYWTMAEFPVAYDPCTCNYPSKLQVEVELINNANVTLEGTLTGTIDQIISPPPGNVNTNTGYKSVSDYSPDFGSVVKAGIKGYETYQSFANQATAFIDDNKNFLEQQMDFELGNFGTVIKAIPYVGALAGIYDIFFAGGKKNAVEQKPTPMAFEVNTNFKLTGAITTTSPFGLRYFFNPGSNPTATSLKPIYDNTLGTFGILETPLVKYINYPRVGVLNIYDEPIVRQYRIPFPVKYAVNPASNLRVKKIDAAIQIRYTSLYPPDLEAPGAIDFPKPVEFGDPYNYMGLSFQERMSRIGIVIEQMPETYPTNPNGLILRTKYVPLQCLSDLSFSLYQSSPLTNQFNLYLKLMVTLERTDDPQAQEVLLILTTPAGIQCCDNFPSGNYPDHKVNYSVNYNCFFPTYTTTNGVTPGSWMNTYFNQNIIENLTLENTSYSLSSTVMNEINIKNNVLLSNGINLKAGRGITIDGTNTYTSGTFEIAYDVSQCSNSLVNNEYTPAQLQSFCAPGGPYDLYSATRIMNATNVETVTELVVGIKAFPNPAKDYFNLEVSDNLPVSEIIVKDVTGRAVKTILNPQSNGKAYQIETDNISSGIYLIEVMVNGKWAKTKLSITK